MKVAVIDNYDSFVYNLVRYLRECKDLTVSVMRNDELDYQELDCADALLLSPGPGIPSEAGDLLKVISRYAQQKPILGICLGHQALGEFFGARLELCEKPLHGKSSQAFLQNPDALFAGIESPFEVGRYHSWRIGNCLPANLLATAMSKEGELLAFRHAHLQIKGLQFHPESILTPVGRTIINNWIKEIRTELMSRI